MQAPDFVCLPRGFILSYRGFNCLEIDIDINLWNQSPNRFWPKQTGAAWQCHHVNWLVTLSHDKCQWIFTWHTNRTALIYQGRKLPQQSCLAKFCSCQAGIKRASIQIWCMWTMVIHIEGEACFNQTYVIGKPGSFVSYIWFVSICISFLYADEWGSKLPYHWIFSLTFSRFAHLVFSKNF
jgi:hypothetical protein